MSEKHPAPTAPPVRRWRLLVTLASIVLVLDQVTKFLAVKYLTRAFSIAGAEGFGAEVRAWVTERELMPLANAPKAFIPLFWSWYYRENRGAAWSMFSTMSDTWRTPFFLLISAAAVALISYYFKKLLDDQKLLMVALSLVMGGALGNLVDRIIRGYVIDFIDWHLNDPDWLTRLHWPTFNVADTGISLGVGLIALDTLLGWWHSRKTRPAAASAE